MSDNHPALLPRTRVEILTHITHERVGRNTCYRVEAAPDIVTGTHSTDQNMDTNELERLIRNLVSIGVVTEVDEKNYRARVRTGENTTDWIRWSVQRAGEAVTWWAPTPGEEVWLLAPGGEMESAFIGGSLYSTPVRPPDTGSTTRVTVHPDGSREQYDPVTSAMTLSGVKTVHVIAADSVTLETPEVTCTEHLTAKTITVLDGGDLHGNFDHSDGAFKSNNIQVDDHDHGNVESGGSWSSGVR